jgi:selenide,water dikinase
MKTLNAEAAVAMRRAGVRAATDITGYGFLGHAWEMIRGTSVGFEVEASKIPLYEAAMEYALQDVFPGGSRANRTWLEGLGAVTWGDEVSEEHRGLLTDAQTSGGLLMCWPSDREVPEHLSVIGSVVEIEPGPGPRITVRY